MSLDIKQAYQAIAGFDEPNPMQTAVWQAITEQNDMGIGLLLKGLTGSGKSEAIAIPSLANGRRLIMVYPTRSLVDDQIGRFQTWLQAYSNHNDGQLLTLTVDTGAQSMRYCYRNGQTEPTPGSERSTRHLYTGNVIITTLDKFIYRFFGFGEPLKSYIYPLRIRYMNPLICFDEAHSYDEIAFINFERLVLTLYKNGKGIALMTATMPSLYVQKFKSLGLDVYDFTDGEGGQAMAAWKKYPHPAKQLHFISASIERQEDVPSEAVECIIAETRQQYSAHKRIIVTVESVKDAAYIFKQLRAESDNIFLYHGRLTQEQRQKVYAKLKEQDKNGNYLLISTSAIEVGCDLNAHILITQLCDPDRLIQRAGRCNRKQTIPDATIIVVGDAIPEWATALNEEQLSEYRQVLEQQHERPFNPSTLIPLMHKELVNDPRVEVMFDMLYEYVYEARLENKNLHENGLVITRSWEPSITLCQGESEKGLIKPITTPISYCRVPKDQESVRFDFGGGFFKRGYDKETHKPVMQPLSNRWENGYSNDIIVCLDNYTYADGDPFEDILGYVDLPFLFNGPFARGAKLIVEHGVDKDKITIWYIDPDNVTIKPNEALQITAVPPENDTQSGNEEESEDDE